MPGVGIVEILAVLAVCGTPIVGFMLFIYLMPSHDPKQEQIKLQAVKAALQCPKCLRRGTIQLDCREIDKQEEYVTDPQDDRDVKRIRKISSFQDHCTACGWRGRKVIQAYHIIWDTYHEDEQVWLENHDQWMKIHQTSTPTGG